MVAPGAVVPTTAVGAAVEVALEVVDAADVTEVIGAALAASVSGVIAGVIGVVPVVIGPEPGSAVAMLALEPDVPLLEPEAAEVTIEVTGGAAA
jgi:hypothetical protein